MESGQEYPFIPQGYKVNRNRKRKRIYRKSFLRRHWKNIATAAFLALCLFVIMVAL